MKKESTLPNTLDQQNLNRQNAYLLLNMIALLIFFTGCGRNQSQESATIAQFTATSTLTPKSIKLFDLVDSELLGASGFSIECDHPEDASLTCEWNNDKPNITPKLDVDIHAGTYARFSISWDQASEKISEELLNDALLDDAIYEDDMLSGHETFTLRATRFGTLTPNLYLIDDSDQRIPVRLASAGLQEGTHEIHIPLAEIRDDDGNKPDFSTVREIQIVFEWADMEGSLELESVRFDSAWREQIEAAPAESAAELSVADGFLITPLVADLQQLTQIAHDADGNMFVSLQNGRVWHYTDNDGDRLYDQRHLYASGLTEIVGLLYDPVDRAVWVGGRGKLYHLADTDADGVADLYTLRVNDLPWGRHQNNGLVWNPDPDPFTGESEQKWIYFGLGSTGDLDIGGELNATILRFPREGSGQESLEIVSRGNRNPYELAWGQVGESSDGMEPTWQLFASENGPDFNDAPDEVNHIRWQHHYGFPEKFGTSFDEPATKIEGLPYSGSLYNVTPHASASGLTYIQNPAWPAAYRTLYVGLFGQVFSEKIVGHTVDRIVLTEVDSPTGVTYRGEPETFVVGLDRPLPLTVDPNGDMLIGDYSIGVIYRVSYVGD